MKMLRMGLGILGIVLSFCETILMITGFVYGVIILFNAADYMEPLTQGGAAFWAFWVAVCIHNSIIKNKQPVIMLGGD